jgi:hypothetical protein
LNILPKPPSGNNRHFVKTLVDIRKAIYVESWSISSDELEIGKLWCIEKRRLHGGLSDGIDIITVNNGRLSFTIVPTRGMGIWKGECQGNFLGWVSPVKDLVHPCYVNLDARGGLGWLDGFNEWIVRCGLSNFGPPGPDTILDNMGSKKDVMLTLHGRIANTVANNVKVKIGLEPPFELEVTGVVYESAMFGSNLKLTTSISTIVGSNALKISDTIENLSSVPQEMQLLYHCNYSKPFLEEGAYLVAPILRMAPRDLRAMEGIDSFGVFGSPQIGFAEQVYFMELLGDKKERTKIMLVGKDETRAVSVSFSVRELPYFTLWKNTAAVEEGYVVGLEPGTGLPNSRRFEREQNRVLKLKSREEFSSEITFSVHLDKDEVHEVNNEIKMISSKTKPRIFKKPIRGFSPS